ncbi:MAG: hypothetical protein ACREO0_04065, partial [Pseudoxanthomonas sp.]
MAENMFERFRPAASPGVSDDNPFKKFASRPSPTTAAGAAAPSTPVAKKPERTWGEVAKDTALGVGQGVVNILGGLTDANEQLQPTGMLRTATTLARRAVPTINLPDIPETTQLAMRAAGAINGVDVDAPTNAEVFGRGTQAITSELSPVLQEKKQDLANTEGFLASAKKVVTTPELLGQFTAEQVPNLVTLGTGSRMAAAGAVEGVVTRAFAGGATREAAEALGREAAKQGAEKFIVGANVGMEAGAASQQAQQDALSLPEEVWAANPQYSAMIANGVDPQEAKRDLSKDTALVARLVGGASGFVGGKIAAPFEAEVFTRTLARRPVAVLQGAAREASEEAVQEGGSQIGSNLGVGQVDSSRGVFEGVPEAAGTGAALGGLMGGGLAIGGASVSKREAARPQPTVEPAGPLTRAADPAAVDVVVPAARPFPQARPGSIADVANLVPEAPPPLPEPPPLPTAKEEAAAARARPDSDNPAEPGYVRISDEFPQQKWQLDSIDARLREAKKAGDQAGVAKALQEKQDYRVSVLRTDTIHTRIDHLKDKDTGEAKFELRSLNAELDKRRAVSTESGRVSTDLGDVSTENGASAPVSAPVAPPPPWVDPETGVMREPADREIEEVMHG